MSLPRIAKLEPRQKPSSKQMLDEIRDAILVAQSYGLQEKLEISHKVMYCLWSGQRSDGTKDSPWPNAIDSRVPEAAKVIKDTVNLMMRAVRSGNVSIGPEGLDDEEKAQLWDKVLRKFRHKSKRATNAAMKLFFQCVQSLGYGILHVDWRARRQLFPQEITTEAVRQWLYQTNVTDYLAEEGGAEGGGQLAAEVEAEISQQVAQLTEEMLLSPDKTQLMDVLQQMDADMPLSEARIAAKSLSKKGVCTYFVPREMGGLPVIKAKVPMVNVVHGMDLTGTDCETWVALPERLSEAGLRERAALNGWTVNIEDLVAKPNQGMTELETMNGGLSWDWLLNGVGVGLQMTTDQTVPWFEVVTVYRVAVNEAGVPAVYESEIFPGLPDELLSHSVLPIVRDGEAIMPFVTMARNPALLAVQSMGIAQEMLTDQMGMKRIIDSSMAAAELAAFPPALRYGTETDAIMPGSTLTVNARNTGSSGAQSRFVDVPGVNMGALRFYELMKSDVAERYHRGADADPNLRTAYEQDLGEEAVLAFTEVIGLLWAHIQAYVDEVVASRIAGKSVTLKATREDLMGTADIQVDFSATSLSQERAKGFAEVGKTLLQLGSKNVDTDALAETMARTYDPELAERIILPADQAAASVLNDERKAIMEMQGGFEVRGRMNAPEARLGAYDEWLQNPANVDRCVYDPGLLELLLLRMQGLEMQQQQYSENVIIGQTGQKPPEWQAQQKRSERLLMLVDQRKAQLEQAQQPTGGAEA